MIPKEYLIDYDNLKVGDSVWLHGQIEYRIDNILDDTYPIIINRIGSFTSQGKTSHIDSHISLFAKPLNFKEQERVILVRHSEITGNIWEQRVLITVKNGKAICYAKAKNIEEAKIEQQTVAWHNWKELEEETIVELTLKDISEGKGVGIAPHLIRIKE